MRQRLLGFLVALLIFLPGIPGPVEQEATSGATPDGDASLLAELGYPVIRFVSDDTMFWHTTTVAAGRYHVVFENQSRFDTRLEVFQLPQGLVLDEALAALEEAATGDLAAPDFYDETIWNGGLYAAARTTAGVVLDFTPGEWVIHHTDQDPMAGEQTASSFTLLVTGEMPALDTPEGEPIGMIEMDFWVLARFEAGPQRWNVVNVGQQVHQLNLWRVPEGTTEVHVLRALDIAYARPATSVVLEEPEIPGIEPGPGISEFEPILSTPTLSPGQFNLVEVDLVPGTYAMVCFLPDPSGIVHVMLGMVELITVE